MIRAIVYDFDGVICDSVNVKTAAFAEMYESYGEAVVAGVVAYHLANGGISRFEKFKYFSKHLLGKNISEEEVIVLANRFSNLVKQKVIVSAYLNGAFSFLLDHAKTHMQFICTGTPETEIIEILKARNISSYFTNIYGSPKTKDQIIEMIMNDYVLKKNEILFIGDAMTDYKAAITTGVSFVGIMNESTDFPSDTLTIKDFTDTLLQSLLVN
jgi:phosphoglycolate phosphatase-like HAD superfamily hydrolase